MSAIEMTVGISTTWNNLKRALPVVTLTLSLLGLASASKADETPLPDGTVVEGDRQIRSAWLAAPTSRYAHGALGDYIEAGAVVAELTSGKRVKFELSPESVFEDLFPRLVDLDRDGRDEIVVIRAYESTGGALSVFKVHDDTIELWLETPAIGIGNRWLNPAGFGDFDGDGQLEIAHVQTPHIGGILIINEIVDGRLRELTRRRGVSNHAYKSRELRLSAVLDIDGKGKDAIVLPTQTRDNLVVARLADGELRFDLVRLDRPIERILATADGIEVTTRDGGQINLSREDLRP